MAVSDGSRTASVTSRNVVSDDLVGLDIEVPSQMVEADAVAIVADISFNWDNVEIAGCTIPVALREARVSVQCRNGGELDKRACLDRAGERAVSVQADTTDSEETATSRKRDARAGASLAGGGATAGGSLGGARSKEEARSDQHERSASWHDYVACVAFRSNKWIVQEVEGQCLNGRYVDDQVLARVHDLPDPATIDVWLYALPTRVHADLDNAHLHGKGRKARKNVNKEKAVEALLQRAVLEQLQADNSGNITLGHAAIESNRTSAA